jgi:large exoprotein involved in heme utilization and adhesion
MKSIDCYNIIPNPKDPVFLGDRGRILAETASGNGGNLDLQIQDSLLLRRNSTISTTAGRQGRGGDGGNIAIEANLLLAAPPEDSDIRANAFTGSGGDITITTQGIVGLQPRQQNTSLSDITASSEFGLNGLIQINSPDVDPNRGLTELPANPVDATRLIAQGCAAGRGETGAVPGEFVMTARGGLPPSPGETGAVGLWQDLRHWDASNGGESQAYSVLPTARPPTALIEAQGWAIDADGQIALTAEPSSVLPYSSWQTPVGCPPS